MLRRLGSCGLVKIKNALRSKSAKNLYAPPNAAASAKEKISAPRNLNVPDPGHCEFEFYCLANPACWQVTPSIVHLAVNKSPAKVPLQDWLFPFTSSHVAE